MCVFRFSDASDEMPRLFAVSVGAAFRTIWRTRRFLEDFPNGPVFVEPRVALLPNTVDKFTGFLRKTIVPPAFVWTVILAIAQGPMGSDRTYRPTAGS